MGVRGTDALSSRRDYIHMHVPWPAGCGLLDVACTIVFLTPGHARRVGRIAFYGCNVLRLCFAAVPARVVSLIHSMRGMFPPSRECTLPLGFPPSLNFRYCFRFSAFSTQ